MGRFTNVRLLGDIRIADGVLEIRDKDATMIASADIDPLLAIELLNSWNSADPVPASVVQLSRRLTVCRRRGRPGRAGEIMGNIPIKSELIVSRPPTICYN